MACNSIEAQHTLGGEVDEMSNRKVIIKRLALLCLPVAALVAVAVSAQSASAIGLYGCKEVGPASLGQYTESHCATDAAHGKYTWTWAADNGLSTDYCLLVGGGGGSRYTDADCSTPSGSGAYEAIELPNEPYFWLLGTTSGIDGVNSTILGIKVEVSCSTMEFAGQPLTLTLISLAKAKLSKCEVKTPTGCTVSSPGEASGKIGTSVLDGVLASVGKEVTLTLKPVSGEVFITVDFSGTGCSVNGVKAEVTGRQICTFGAGVSTPAVEHALTCEPSGSELKYAGAAVSMKGSVTNMLEPILYWKIV